MAGSPNDASDRAGAVPVTVPGWAGRFIGIPYRDDGWGFDGANCCGLIYLVLKHRAGIEIAPQGDVSADDVERATNRLLSVSGNAPWHPVLGARETFDVALLRGNPLHCGIVIAPGWLLHVWRAPASMAMRLDDPRIRERFIGFYRHSALA